MTPPIEIHPALGAYHVVVALLLFFILIAILSRD